MAFRDLIAGTADFQSVENIQRARTRGIEVAAQVMMPAGVELRAHYTLLEADNLTSGTRLLRRPRHRGGIDLAREFGRGVFAGAAVTFAAQREDVHARTFRSIDQEDYTVVRIHGSWRVSERLTLQARIENVLDETYEEVNGYPALGTGAFGSVAWTF
jgi:outer membrane cobalamin receptor